MDNSYHGVEQVRLVSTFNQLVNAKFEGSVNAICWSRKLMGDFQELTSKLHLIENITEISVEELLQVELSEAGILARQIIINDLNLLTEWGASPSLNLIKCYERDDALNFISTDVYSYHVDCSPVETDTFLCTYFGASGDIIPNDQAEQKILIPEIRNKLMALYDGDEGGFERFLKEYFFDLHYQPKLNSNHVNLGTGHLWRLAVDHPGQEVLPCVHRAPIENEGENRLLLIC